MEEIKEFYVEKEEDEETETSTHSSMPELISLDEFDLQDDDEEAVDNGAEEETGEDDEYDVDDTSKVYEKYMNFFLHNSMSDQLQSFFQSGGGGAEAAQQLQNSFGDLFTSASSSSSDSSSAVEKQRRHLDSLYEHLYDYFETVGSTPSHLQEIYDALIHYHQDNHEPFTMKSLVAAAEYLAPKLLPSSVSSESSADSDSRPTQVLHLLKIFVNDDKLKPIYKQHIDHHNRRILDQGALGDSGFDLLVPDMVLPDHPPTVFYFSNQTHFLDHRVHCSMTSYHDDAPTGFYLYPRSSISKTPLSLANSVGIIDAGYRGPMIAAMHCHVDHSYQLDRDRLVQICHPDLRPVYIVLVDKMEDLSKSTVRGSGGFGSTG
jgi:dUTP pyrophosphatase